MTSKQTGPFDERAWPTKLSARVVTAGDAPRIHGYDAERDLARNYGFSETLLLSVTGALPSRQLSRAFDVALQFLAPVSVAEAPVHAAVLARICGARSSGIMGTGTIALAEQARFTLGPYCEHLSWLTTPTTDVPHACRSRNEQDRSSVNRLRSALAPTNVRVQALDMDIGRDAAILAVLCACGLTRPEQLEIAMVVSRLPTLMAEALATPPQSFLEYPINLPTFEYEDTDDR